MSVVSVEARSFILALFIRDDGERFLLGDNGYDFIDSQLHFVANTIENDEVEKQGADGVMLAGQVRRASVQTFDGYVGDATTPKDKVEEMRREFIAFFAKDHHFRVIYVDCNRNAWQRKGGYLVDAPEVKELWQIHPEYHVGLNFEDVNYYEYDENAEGQEILANIMKVPISSDVEGGLVWDEDGAVSENATVVYDGDTATASGKSISVSDAVEAPLSDFKLKGETSQQTYTGKNLFNNDTATDAYIQSNGAVTSNTVWRSSQLIKVNPNTSYIWHGEVYGANQVVWAGYNSSSAFVSGQYAQVNGASSLVITTGASTEYLRVGYRSDGMRNMQLELGSTATAYEPFVGGIPAPNPDYPQAVQTVTGENVVKICGKNLFDKSKATLGYRIGGDGTPYADSPYFISDYIPVKASTAYHINTANVGGSSAIATYDKDKVFIRRILGDGYQNIVTDANALYIRFATSQTVIDQAQLELGSTATAYEPYQGQSYEVNLGKNLFDKSTATDGYRIDSAGVPYADDEYFLSDYIEVMPSTTYTYSRAYSGSTRSAYAFYDGSKTFISRTYPIIGTSALSGSITTPANAKYMRFADTENVLNNAQLELGSTATSYAAYFTPIELCKIGTYQDYIYKSGGKWYVHKAVGKHIFDGSETFTADSSYSGIYQYRWTDSSVINISNQDTICALSDKFYGRSYRNSWEYDFSIVPRINANALRFMTSLSTTYSAFQTWLASNPTTVYYALATPTDTEITNEALVAQLEAILSQGKTYAGTNNITTVISAGNEQGELEVGYYTRYEFGITAGGYVWEQGGSGGPTIIVNDSISAVSPVWTVYGPALNPQLENATNGDAIEYVGMVSDGQTLVIDMGEQTAKLDGLNVISNVTGDFISLESGANTLLYSAGNDAPESEIGWSEIVG